MKLLARSLARASGAMERGFSGAGVAGGAIKGLLGLAGEFAGEDGGLGNLVFGDFWGMGAKTTVFLKMESRQK